VIKKSLHIRGVFYLEEGVVATVIGGANAGDKFIMHSYTSKLRHEPVYATTLDNSYPRIRDLFTQIAIPFDKEHLLKDVFDFYCIVHHKEDDINMLYYFKDVLPMSWNFDGAYYHCEAIVRKFEPRLMKNISNEEYANLLLYKEWNL
jgi:hypothetical protein